METGRFTKTDSTYVSAGTNGQTVYHIVRVRGVEYLLDDQTHQEYVRTRDSEKLYGKLLRAG